MVMIENNDFVVVLIGDKYLCICMRKRYTKNDDGNV